MERIKSDFADQFTRCLKAFYQGRLPSFAKIARDFSLRAPHLPHVSAETVRHWVRGSSLPHVSRMQVLVDWLGPEVAASFDNHARALLAGRPAPDSIQLAELDAWVQAGTLEYLGRMEDVRPAIAACSVYVLPSYREGTPRTVLEAMAMGRPIITTDAPGCRETVIDGENGFLVPVKSVDALVEAMERFINEPDLAARMGKRSREIAEEKYDVHKVNAVMIREMGL